MPAQTVLITGASGGIGREIALKYNSNGYNVVINGFNSPSKLYEFENVLKQTNKNVLSILADVSHYDEATKMFDNINSVFGNVDVLINNAGVSYVGLFNEMTPKQWTNVININLMSVLNCCHLAVEKMINNKNGVIINISSIWGLMGASCEAVYSASKGGMNAFSKALAKELGPCNIRVNTISCGVIDTQMNGMLDCDEVETLERQIPLGYFGKGIDVAELAYFLSLPKARYITGQIIGVDGGII